MEPAVVPRAARCQADSPLPDRMCPPYCQAAPSLSDSMCPPCCSAPQVAEQSKGKKAAVGGTCPSVVSRPPAAAPASSLRRCPSTADKRGPRAVLLTAARRQAEWPGVPHALHRAALLGVLRGACPGTAGADSWGHASVWCAGHAGTCGRQCWWLRVPKIGLAGHGRPLPGRRLWLPQPAVRPRLRPGGHHLAAPPPHPTPSPPHPTSLRTGKQVPSPWPWAKRTGISAVRFLLRAASSPIGACPSVSLVQACSPSPTCLPGSHPCTRPPIRSGWWDPTTRSPPPISTSHPCGSTQSPAPARLHLPACFPPAPQVVALKMVNAQGAIVAADPKQNADLLAASCGGGGGNFGERCSCGAALAGGARCQGLHPGARSPLYGW